MFTREKLGKSPKTKNGNLDYGYLVCKNCDKYYKLSKATAEFEFCQCGGGLKYVKDIDDYLDQKKHYNLEKKVKEQNDELLKTKKELENVISDSKQSMENFQKKLNELEKKLEKKSNELLKTKEALEIEISEHKEKEEFPKKREKIIEIKNLKKSYDNGKIKALNGIDLEIEKGEFVSIIGPSGSGKSTLLNMIGALDKADDGYINVKGVDFMQKKDLSQFRSKEIGFVFQLHNLIPNLTVIENVQIPMFENKLSGKEMERRALELLKAVDLEDKIDQTPNKLSGGERQRVAIARALVNHPSIILADEPTGALDSKTGDMILNLLKDLHKKENVTLVMVTHEPYVAEMADRTITVLDGTVAVHESLTE